MRRTSFKKVETPGATPSHPPTRDMPENDHAVPEDIELLRRYTEGEVQAFEALVRRYERPMYNFVLRFTRQHDRAEDLVQEVFLKVLRNAKRFEGKAKFSTWLYTLARNLCIDHIRREKHRKHKSLEAAHTSNSRRMLKDTLPSSTAGPARAAAAQDITRRVAEAVESLPPEQREVFLLRQLQGLPFREIAEIVDVSENTVKSRMRYALERLQEMLQDYEEHARRVE